MKQVDYGNTSSGCGASRKFWSMMHSTNAAGKSQISDLTGAMMRIALLVIPAVLVCVLGCGQQAQSAELDRQQLVERCNSLVSQNRLKEGAACFAPFERDAKPDRQTAAAAYQLGQLYESGRGVPADPDHAVRLYKLAAGLRTVAPEIAQQASVAATRLINRMRQAEEP